VKIKDLAPGQDGGQYLLLFGSGKDEYGMSRRFFKRFQERVKRGLRKHMHLINDINAVFSYLGQDTHFIDETPDIVHRVVGGSIEFMNIKGA
jgi:hypothetical protein